MFWASILNKNQSARLNIQDDTEDQDVASLHITNAIMGPDCKGKLYI